MKIFEYNQKEFEKPTRGMQDVANSTIEPAKHGYAKSEETIANNIMPSNAGVYHKNYLEYLASAYASHGKIVFSPHIVWYTILSELSQFIQANSEECRDLFTRSPDKISIMVGTGDVTKIDLNAIKDELIELVPVDINLFLPSWSTSTEQSNMACLASFCEACTPYYNYFTYMCGFNAIKIEGTYEDWSKMKVLSDELSGMIPGKGSVYLERVSNRLVSIIKMIDNDDKNGFADILKMVHCGSGSQQEANGWFLDFFMENPSLKFVSNFNSHIAKVPYENMETKRKFNLCYGLFSSNIDSDGFWVPEFSNVINEKLPHEEKITRKSTDGIPEFDLKITSFDI